MRRFTFQNTKWQWEQMINISANDWRIEDRLRRSRTELFLQSKALQRLPVSIRRSLIEHTNIITSKINLTLWFSGKHFSRMMECLDQRQLTEKSRKITQTKVWHQKRLVHPWLPHVVLIAKLNRRPFWWLVASMGGPNR